MKAFLLAVLALAAISTGAYYGLHEAGFSAAQRTSSSAAVRLGE